VLIVVGIVAVFLGLRTHSPTRAGSGGGHRSVATGVLLTFRAEPTPRAPGIDSTVMQQAASVVRGRLDAVAPGAQVSTRGHELIVRVGGQVRTGVTQTFPSAAEVVSLASAPARLLLYDWEANALTPSGKPVASLLLTRDPSAVAISQGAGTPAPGSPGAGSMTLYQAVKLAAKQPTQASSTNARLGPEYFAFGAPGSSACAAAARAYQASPIVGQHCYLAGPQDNLSDLQAAMPTGVSTSSNGVQTLTVQQGWVVLQALPSGGFNQELPSSNPSAQYYVLRDRVALFGNEITNPQQSTDPSGSPNVTFGFTRAGRNAFQTVTAQIAHRGELVSGFGQTLNQHFAFALDTQLLTVPLIDFKAYPNGISAGNGADITGGLTRTSARQLAAELRLGPLPVHLRLLSINGRSAHSS
jgi:SecD/SecF fusion protein